VPPVTTAFQAGQSFGGRNLARAMAQPMIAVKTDIGDGKDPAQALKEGRAKLVALTGLATDSAAREAQRVEMDLHPMVQGWRRAVKGTCDACLGLADSSTAPAGTPLEIHPNCECVSEPVVGPSILRPSEPGGREEGMFVNELGELTNEEMDALETYTGPGYTDMNRYLRWGDKKFTADELSYLPSKIEVKDNVKRLDKCFEKVQPLENTKIVYRGTEDYKGIEVGDTVTDKGFVSTTQALSEASNFGDDRVIIECPPGTRAIDIVTNNNELGFSNSAYLNSEEEWLLPRGSRFVVTEIKKEYWDGSNWTTMQPGLPGSFRERRIVHMRLVLKK
jgi:hypothetical protein